MSAPAKRPGAVDAAAVDLDALMAHALAIEVDAAERYAELADAMEAHNNEAVASLFRKMCDVETRHADTIRAQMGWSADAALPAAAEAPGDAPETVAHEELHYLMHPYHALEAALAAEERAERFFRALADSAVADSVRDAARALADEEHMHVKLVRQWMQMVGTPERDWAVDPDPPRYTD